MRKVYYILLLVMLLCVGCEWHMKKYSDYCSYALSVDRYDIIQSKYLVDSDYSAYEEMAFDYPMQTHILVENVLGLGKFGDPDIDIKLRCYFQDTILQSIIKEVDRQYADMSDINEDLSEAFLRLKAFLPGIKIPIVYSQIGALSQSIIVSDGLVGVCLDKYLGADYPLYSHYYLESQRRTMKRSMIVPDCLAFYLLSCYPLSDSDANARAMHRGKIQWVVNHVAQREVFVNENVEAVGRFMKTNKALTIEELLTDAEIVLDED